MVTTDVLSWVTKIDQAFGILFRANNIGLGTTEGYVFNYNSADFNLQLNTIAGEAAADTIAEVHVVMDPSHQYRWVLTAYDNNVLGQVFQLPDTTNPIASVVATDGTTAAGAVGVFNFDRADFADYAGADSTFDNFRAVIPTPGSLAAITEELSPAPNSIVQVPRPPIKIAVLDRETTVDRGSFAITVDGQAAPTGEIVVTEGVLVPNNADPFGGATATWVTPGNLASGPHTVTAVYADGLGAKFTNSWTFNAVFLDHPVAGTVGDRGFNIFVVQAPQDPQLPNNVDTAEAQLTTNSAITRLYATNVVDSLINFSGSAFDGNSAGTFDSDEPIPGQIDAITTKNWAMEVKTYLDLPVGLITLGVQSDDGYEVTSGNLVLGSHRDGVANETFQFYVAKAGLYPFRLVWNQSGGGAYVEWFAMAASGHADTGGRVLLNSADTYHAYLSVTSSAPVLVAAATVSGPYNAVAGAVPNTSNHTFTIPIDTSADARYYRVSAEQAVDIVSVKAEAGNLVITYTP
jgi:hypothetical protein